MKFANKLAPGIDIKQGGGYIMVEPSMHESGQEYGWEASSNPLDGISIEMAPPWLMQMSTRPTITSVSKAMATYSVDEVTVADLRAALLHVDPDDRDTWVRVGHALKTIGDVGLDIWDQWSQRSPKYKAEEIVYRWHGFAPHNITYKTVFHAAQECGWVNTAKRRSESATPEVTITYTESEAADLQSETRLPPSVPQHIIDSMPGVLKIAHEWMCKTAYRPLPEVLAISSISLIATAMGRIFSVDGKLRTNLMFVSAAGSGTGKEHGPTCVDTALSAAGCEGLVGGARIASSAGLITRLQRSPCTLYQIDEFGLRLQAMRAKNSGSHEKQIMVELMELATSAHKIYRGTDYAEVRDTQVQYPCLNLNATTTQAELFPAFSGADIVNGAINRMMIVFGPELADHGQRPAKVPVPKALVDWIKAVRTTVVPIQSGAELRGEDAWDVPVSPMAQKLFEALDALCVEKQADLQKAGMAPLWLRGGVFARQLALVYAVAECANVEQLAESIKQDKLSISPSAAQWAIDLFTAIYTRMELELKARVSDSEFDKAVNDVVRVIHSKGKRGLTKREISQFSRFFRSLKPREQDEVLQAAAVVRGAITLVRVAHAGGRGRPRDAYVAAEFLSNEDADL